MSAALVAAAKHRERTPFLFDVDGQQLTGREVSPARWLLATMRLEGQDVTIAAVADALRTLFDEPSFAAILDRLMDVDDPFVLADAYALVRTACESVTGRPYLAAVALARWMVEAWSLLDGQCALAGVELLTLDVQRVLNVVEVIAVRAMTEAERAAFDKLNLWPAPAAVDGTPAGFRGEVSADEWMQA